MDFRAFNFQLQLLFATGTKRTSGLPGDFRAFLSQLQFQLQLGNKGQFATPLSTGIKRKLAVA
jgi:hypothetical protein